MYLMNHGFRSLVRNVPKQNLFEGVQYCSVYKSDVSLDKFYPNSSLKLTTVTQPPKTDEKFSGYIPMDQLEITYSRSSGPGGQNVNKVNTKVDIRFKPDSASWIHPDIRPKLLEKVQQKLTKEGYLVFKSDITRSQQLNVADCLEKIRALIRTATQEEPVQSPETAEKIRRKIEKAARERLYVKRERSTIKASRQSPSVREIL